MLTEVLGTPAGVSEVVWEVRPLNPPRVLRRCARCDLVRPFEESGRFRVNANQRRLDVWLIYRCSECEATWNFEVHARVRPEALGPEALGAYHRNDPEEARRCAFGVVGVPGLRTEACAEVEIVAGDLPPGPVFVRIRSPEPVGMRLDKVLARGLGVSRSGLAGWVRQGTLVVLGGDKRALGRALRDGQEIFWRR